MIRLAIVTAVVVGTLLGLYIAWQIRDAVMVFLLSLWLAAAIRPAGQSLGRGGLRKAVGLTGAYIVGIGAVLLLAGVTFTQLAHELQRAADDLIAVHDHIVAQWPSGDAFQQAIARRLPDPEALLTALAGGPGEASVETLLGNVMGIAEGFVNLIVIVVLAVYWSVDRVRFERLWLSLLPLRQRTVGRDIWRAVESEVGAYFRAEGVQSLLAGVVLWIGYRLLGFHYPTLMATTAALLLLFPWVGAPLSVLTLLVLAAPQLILEGGLAAVVVGVLYTAAVLLFLELFVEPRFFNRQRYSSLLTAVAAIALTDVAGPLGLLLGPPLAVGLQVLGEHWVRRRASPATAEPSPPWSGIEERIQWLQSDLRQTDRPPPDLTSLVDRLAGLVEQSKKTPADSEPGQSRPLAETAA